MHRIEAMLKEQEKQERAAMRELPATAELRDLEGKIAPLRKAKLGPKAEQAALLELQAERETLTARANGQHSPGLREARQLLAQLPSIAKTFDKRLEATLTGGKATRDEMRMISDATRQLIKGGVIRMRPKKKTLTGWPEFLRLGEKALRVAGATRRARVSGSGGALLRLETDWIEVELR